MKKLYILIWVSLGILWFTSCEKGLERDLQDVSVSVATNENVSYNRNILTVKKNTPIEFHLHGSPDYVSFFSGEIGNQYINRNRKEINVDDIESCMLKFSVWGQYGSNQGEYQSCKDLLDLLFWTDQDDMQTSEQTDHFPGLSKTNFEEDSVLVEEQTHWNEFIPRAEMPQKSVGNSLQATYCERSVKEFIGKKIALAFVLNGDKKEAPTDPKLITKDNPTGSIIQSTFHIQDMRVETKWKNGRTTKLYASSFGFTPLNMKNKTKFKDQNIESMPLNREYGSVTSSGVPGMWHLMQIARGELNIAGAGLGYPWKYSWLVSDFIHLNEYSEVDTPVKVKDISSNNSSYSYTYSETGFYIATFLINNFNYTNEATKTCEFIIEVTE